MQQYAGVYLQQNYSTCCRCLSHPSSGVHQIVTAASGTGHNVRATTFRQGGVIRPRWRKVVALTYLLQLFIALTLIYCKITLHVSGVYRTHHQEYIKL